MMQCSNINLRETLQSIEPTWQRDVILSEAAVSELEAASREHKIASDVAYRALASSFLRFLSMFANNSWFNQYSDHWFTSFKLDDLSTTSDEACVFEHGFVMRRDGNGRFLRFTIVSESEGYLSQDYHAELASELGKIICRTMEEPPQM